MQKLFVAALTWLLITPSGVSAQGLPVNRQESVILGYVITTGTSWEGKVRDAALREAARLVPGPATAQQQPLPPPNWARRHPVLLGTFVGAGVFAGLGAISPGCTTDNAGHPCPSYNVAVLGPIGAGIGALVGFVVSRR